MPAPAPALPPEAPLAMPAQPLHRPGAPMRTGQGDALRLGGRRLFVFGGALLLTAFAGYEMYQVLDVGGLTALEALVLVLFVMLFAWIGLSFMTVLGGLIASRDPLGIRPDGPLPPLTLRTAILLPVYNEEPARVFAGLEATCQSLLETGRGDLFDVFVLSDTTNADVWVAEEAEYLALRARLPDLRLFYRRRAENVDRKAGNIAEWVTRFGGAYEAMLVLDADSVMSGDCVVRATAALEADPGLGLVQTLPVIVGGRTPLARLQQFAGRLYGPLIARGLAWWHGPHSNYWGHNAVIRTRAFAGSAGLPHLKGRKPFGGHVLSHDFIEAAFLLRAGWGVRMLPQLTGSYEEGPPSLSELIVRDRRWCQGNLQHLAILPARGLRLPSRMHLLTGIGSYVTAPLWLLLLVAGLLTALQARFVPPNYFPSGFALFPTWPAQDPIRAAWVFGGTMAVLFLPKLFAYGAMLADRQTRIGFGGAGWTFLNLLWECLLSALCAPVIMVSQSMHVFSILSGRDGGWAPQQRDDGSIGWRAAFVQFLPQTVLGLVFTGATAAISWPLLAWMSPVILGLLLSVPLAVLTGRGYGRPFWLAIPEDRAPPQVLLQAKALRSGARPANQEAVARLAADPALLAFHRASLPEGGQRVPGDVRPERLIARAKVEDAESRPEALSRLTPREKAAALGDHVALAGLLRLPEAAGPVPG